MLTSLRPFSHRFSHTILSVALLVLGSFAAFNARAATVGTDTAANYGTANPWVNGSTGGTGFGTWDLSGNNNNGNTLFAGYFLGDSTAGSGNINTGGQSFAMYANPNGAFADASRSFGGGALTIGQTFSLQLAVAFRNGDKGFNLLTSGTQAFNFDVGQSGTGTDGYYYSVGTGAATSTGFTYYSDSVFTLSYTQQLANSGSFTISRTSASGGAVASNSINVPLTTSGVSGFTLYESNTTDGSAQNNLYFNNLQIAVPEPSSVILGALGLTALAVTRRRKA